MLLVNSYCFELNYHNIFISTRFYLIFQFYSGTETFFNASILKRIDVIGKSRNLEAVNDEMCKRHSFSSMDE